jgi:hypothetical protein
MFLIPRIVLEQLVELAEEALFTQATEFSNQPTAEEKLLMCAMWKQLEKPVPPWFARKGWSTDSELATDG